MKKEKPKKVSKKVVSRKQVPVRDKLQMTLAELIPDMLKEAKENLPLKKMVRTPEWTLREVLISDSIADLIKILEIALKNYPGRDKAFDELLRAIHFFTMKILIGFNVKPDKLINYLIENNQGTLFDNFITRNERDKLYIERDRRDWCLNQIQSLVYPRMKDVEFLSDFYSKIREKSHPVSKEIS